MRTSKSSLPQTIAALLVVGLALSTFWYQSKLESSQKQLGFVQDTLTNILSRNEDWTRRQAHQLLKMGDLALGDSLLESHIITWATSQLFVAKVDVYTDSTVKLQYRRGVFREPTDIENLKLTLLFEQKRVVPYSKWAGFHERMAKVEFLNAIKNEDYMCCITTGKSMWKAKSKAWGTLEHSTWCRQSAPFAEACEFAFQFFDDPDLARALKLAQH